MMRAGNSILLDICREENEMVDEQSHTELQTFLTSCN